MKGKKRRNSSILGREGDRNAVKEKGGNGGSAAAEALNGRKKRTAWSTKTEGADHGKTGGPAERFILIESTSISLGRNFANQTTDKVA